MNLDHIWGSPNVVPEGAIAAWGARLIVTQDGQVDLLWDRMGDDSGPHTQELIDRLNDGLIKHMRETISALLTSYEMSTRDGADFILHMDDRVVMHANTKGSHGYCYVTAWLYEEEKV